MKPSAFSHLRADSASAAVQALKTGAKVLAGGQSLGPMLNLRLARPEALVNVSALPGMIDICEKSDKLCIGAGVTHARIEDGKDDVSLPPMMRHVARGIAYRAVRNKGTIGGSLAHADPAADWLTAMTALDAAVIIREAGGKERSVPISAFMLGAYRTVLDSSELLIRVEIRKQLRDAFWGYDKVCRKVGEFAEAIGALVVHPDSGFIRLVAGATGGPPLILTDLGASIAAKATRPARDEVRAALAARLTDVDDVKLHLMTTALCRAIEKVLPE
ncbi:FAD binding domain-containing protein [Leisingera sp.]|uniref:FAD binding domain-containing protein n=1 Tax=Leisingera sp. TaxID=1879318 RepID=UPI002B277923|nr:FAD binding domain-containing protein [Leisingera sp.]